MTVLIVTKRDDDLSVTGVCESLKEREINFFRLDSDLFPTKIQISSQYGESSDFIRITDYEKNQELLLNDVSAVWYRRFDAGGQIPRVLEKELREPSVQESRAVILGILTTLAPTTFILDPIRNVRRAGHKPLQLQVARSLGLSIPATLITNNPPAVHDFAARCHNGMVTKMLSSFAVYDEQGRENVVFTSRVKPEDLEDLAGLSLCPMTFQELIPKAMDLRITIVGDQIFTAGIESSAITGAEVDWRRKGFDLVDSWIPHQLPKEVEDQLLKLMDHFGLHYGAIDMILTPDDRYVFLEINPVGDFFWLDRLYSISAAIAEVLSGNHRRTEP